MQHQPTAAILPLIVVHGGAGDIPDARDRGKLDGCRLAAHLGYAQLAANGSAVDAVEAAVRSMELDEHFNAGYGAVLDLAGNAVLDVSIQDGRTLAAGAATLFGDVLQPITLARRIMERSRHSFLGGDGAVAFAQQHGIEIMRPAGQLVTQYARDALDEFRQSGQDGVVEIGHRRRTASGEKLFGEVGTVGAVAIDRLGNVAAATSTGGMTGKVVGRIGDTPVLGAGTFADNAAGAVSTTGHGETIMRYALAARIAGRMELLDEGAQAATQAVLEAMQQRLGNGAGAIAVDRHGDVGIWWTSPKMAWAWQSGDEEVHFGIRRGEEFVEKV